MYNPIYNYYIASLMSTPAKSVKPTKARRIWRNINLCFGIISLCVSLVFFLAYLAFLKVGATTQAAYFVVISVSAFSLALVSYFIWLANFANHPKYTPEEIEERKRKKEHQRIFNEILKQNLKKK